MWEPGVEAAASPLSTKSFVVHDGQDCRDLSRSVKGALATVLMGSLFRHLGCFAIEEFVVKCFVKV